VLLKSSDDFVRSKLIRSTPSEAKDHQKMKESKLQSVEAKIFLMNVLMITNLVE